MHWTMINLRIFRCSVRPGATASMQVELNRACFASRSLKSNLDSLGIGMKCTKTESMAASEKVRPENARFTFQIQKAVNRRDWVGAHRVFLSIPDPNEINYCAIINAAAELRYLEEGQTLLAHMEAASISPGVATYTALLKMFGLQNDQARARTLYYEGLQNLPEACTYAPLLNSFLDVLARAGKASEVWQEMQAAEARGTVLDRGHFACLLKALRESVCPEAAFSWLEYMRQRGLKTTIQDYTLVLGACVKEIAVSKDDANADEYLSRLMLSMGEHQVAPNKYFLEEHVALMLGIDRLKDFTSGDMHGITVERRDKALGVIEKAVASGLQLTKGLQLMKSRLTGQPQGP